MKKFKLANLITYLGVVFSVTAMISASKERFNVSMACFILAGISDLFDGKFASRFKRTNEEKMIGIELDSLSDVINFLICPVVLCLFMGFQNWYSYLVFILYVFSGITRLAVFNVNASENHVNNPVKYYNGLPTTYAAIVFPLFWMLSFLVNVQVFRVVYCLVMLAVAYLFVAPVKIVKPRGEAYIYFAIVAACMVGIFLFILK